MSQSLSTGGITIDSKAYKITECISVVDNRGLRDLDTKLVADIMRLIRKFVRPTNKPVHVQMTPCITDFQNMNMFFSEAFECNYSQHCIEEQHVKFVEKNVFPCTFQYTTSAHMNIQYLKSMAISQSWSE